MKLKIITTLILQIISIIRIIILIFYISMLDWAEEAAYLLLEFCLRICILFFLEEGRNFLKLFINEPEISNNRFKTSQLQHFLKNFLKIFVYICENIYCDLQLFPLTFRQLAIICKSSTIDTICINILCKITEQYR